MGQKHIKRFPEFRMPFPLRDIRKIPRSMHVHVPQAMAQFILSNGNRTEGSPIRSVIIHVLVIIVYHEYDYRLNWMTRRPITN